MKWKRGLIYAGAAAAIYSAGLFTKDAAAILRKLRPAHETVIKARPASFPIDMPAVAKPKPVVKEKPKAVSELDWKRTHLVILNGRAHPINDESAVAAAMAGLENGAKRIYVAGLESKDLDKRIRGFGDGSIITNEDWRKLLLSAMDRFEKDDTLFVYITGNSDRTKFEVVEEYKIDHTSIPRTLAELFGGRLVLLLDQNPCEHFLDALAGRGRFSEITLISSAKKNEAKGGHFGKRFWDSLKERADPDKDGRSTLKDAFAIGMTEHEGVEGTYRDYKGDPPMVKTLKDISDGVVMVTADWCGACKQMAPVFRTMDLYSTGTIGFYRIDAKDFIAETGENHPLPYLFVKRNGKVMAGSSGAMRMDQFIEWLKKNGTMGPGS
ncbi:MAG: thioredoxin family protein [Candidatus Micrarchaeota archaeon]